jgi:hypothetical protein
LAEVGALPSATPEVVFTGDLDEVNQFFQQNSWSDGLPVVPPTLERVEKFLAHSSRSPGEVLGILPASGQEASIWTIAVNGVMAGCRPAYMPLLIAAIEVLLDPNFRIEDAGSTPGWEPLMILNGPAIQKFELNFTGAALRIGEQANATLGRFLRLYMRNVGGLRPPPHGTDKATIGLNFNVALAENEAALAEMGWPSFANERGFPTESSVVTVQSVIGIGPPVYSAGDNPEDHVAILSDAVARDTWGYWAWSGLYYGQYWPLLIMSPSVARVFAQAGWTKNDLRQALAEAVLVPGEKLERYAWHIGITDFSLSRLADEGRIPAAYGEVAARTTNLVALLQPERIGIIVAGDPARNQSRGLIQNHEQGPPISREAALT